MEYPCAWIWATVLCAGFDGHSPRIVLASGVTDRPHEKTYNVCMSSGAHEKILKETVRKQTPRTLSGPR
jgi:hypothetical protein